MSREYQEKLWFGINAGGTLATMWDETRKVYFVPCHRSHEMARLFWDRVPKADRPWAIGERIVSKPKDKE